MSAAPALPDDDDLLAAELAFGLVEGEERGAAERRLASDPAFAAAHARWTARGAAMPAGRDEAPRPSLWPAIVARLPANDAAAPGVPDAARGWRLGALAASAVAAMLAIVLVGRAVEPWPRRVAPAAPGTSAPAAPRLIAVLVGKASPAVVTVSFDPGRPRLIVAPAGLRVPDGSAELWVIPADGRPRSLGVVAAAEPGSPPPRPAALAALATGATLAISVEPAGGSPSGAPTGPVILSGIVRAI